MILLVEDEPLARHALARRLSLNGYRVMAAADGEQATELLDRLPFDLVITDLGLPKVSGFQLISRIRARWPNLPIVVVSGETNAAAILKVQVEFFPKPVDSHAVIEAVKRLTPRPLRLRDHALVRNWPPVWTKFTGPSTNKLRREIGVLRQVRFRSTASNQCFLLIEHGGEFFMGALMFHDATFGLQISELLQRQVNRSIREIGDLDLSHTL